MDLQDENILLGKRIAKLENELTFTKRNLFDALIDNDSLRDEIHELEDKLKEGQEFPLDGDKYWFMSDSGGAIDTSFYNSNYYIDNDRIDIGNFFKGREDTEFAIEKLKVEAELRKFSRPFECGEINQYIFLDTDRDRIDVENRYHFPTQGTIYFDSKEKVQQALKSVGADRIKKYIFGVEEQ